MKAHAAGKILTVTLRDGRVLIFSCNDNRRLHLLRILADNQKLLSINQSFAVFAERENGKATTSFINLAEKDSEPVAFPNQDARFIALDKSNVFFQILPLDLIFRFNVQSKEMNIINDHQSVPALSIQFPQTRKNGIIHIVDDRLVYRVIDGRTFRQLYSTALPDYYRRDRPSQVKVSSNGLRVMLRRIHKIDMFEIIDPAFPRSLQPLKEPAKPVKKPMLFNAKGDRINRSFLEHQDQYQHSA